MLKSEEQIAKEMIVILVYVKESNNKGVRELANYLEDELKEETYWNIFHYLSAD